MQEFLNPKSMLTPGLAGSLMMFLVNGLTSQFPEIQPRYCALILSFLIAGVVFTDKIVTKSLAEKVLYFVLNSLVIFVVGFGSANLAADATGKGQHRAELAPLVAVAHAQEPALQLAQATPASPQAPGSGGAASQDKRALQKQLQETQAENEQLKKRLEMQQQEKDKKTPSAETDKSRTFFKKW